MNLRFLIIAILTFLNNNAFAFEKFNLNDIDPYENIIVEEMFELNCDGQYKFNDGIHEDFTDKSEAKTGTLHANGQSSTAEITNVRSANGVLKHGAIRCVMLNPRLKKLHFLFIPQASLRMIMANRKKTKSAMLRYNKKKEQFTTLEKYGIIELDSFKELAMEANR